MQECYHVPSYCHWIAWHASKNPYANCENTYQNCRKSEFILSTRKCWFLWRKIKLKCCIQHCEVISKIGYWWILCEVKENLFSSISKPLIRRIEFEPNWDFLHEIYLHNVPRSAIPIKRVRILRTYNCNIPICRVPARKH